MPEETQAGTLVWDLATGTALFQKGLQAAGAALGQFAGVLKSTNFLMVAGWAAVGIAAFKAAQKAIAAVAGIDSALREVATLLPETAEQLGVVRRELIDLSTRVPQPPELLTEATYQAISAGFTDLGDALDIVGVSAKAAVAGLTDTFTAVDAITTALNAYQYDAEQAGRVSDVFFKTVEQGKIRFEELAQNFGTVATSAALAGVTLEETNAAIATLTKFGINAAEATTSLNRAILSIIKPTKAQKEAAAKYGVELSATALETKGFTGVLRELEEATQGNVEALAEIFPNIRAARSIFVLAGNGADEFRRILLEVGNSSGATQAAFQDMNLSLENQRALLANNINALWASLGAQLLPAVLDITRALNKAFESQTETLRRLAEETGDYARAQELAEQAQAERLTKELENLEDRFKVEQETARLRSQIAQLPRAQLEAQFGPQLADILTQTFDIRDGWENVEEQLRLAVAAAKDQLNTLREQDRINPKLEEALYNRIALYQQLLGIAQAFLANEQTLGEQLDAETPAERALQRAEERLARRRRFAPPGSDLIKEAEELVRIKKAEVALEGALRRQNLLTVSARAKQVDLSKITLENSNDILEAEGERLAKLDGIIGLTEVEIAREEERAQIRLDYARALQEEADARAALAGDDQAPSTDAIDRFRQMNLELQKYFAELAKTDLIEQFLEGLTGLERAIALENINAAKQKLEEWIELAARAQREGWRAVMLDLNKEAEKTTESVELQAQRLRQWLNAGLKGKDLVDLMKEYKIDIDAVTRAFPKLGAELKAAMNARPIDELLDSLSLLLRGLGEFSNALGVISNSAVRAINQVSLLTDGIRGMKDVLSQISAGTFTGGVAGFLGPVGAIIGGAAGLISLAGEIFGGGPSPEEIARKQAIQDNTEAVKRLKTSVDRQVDALRDLRSADFGQVAKAVGVLSDDAVYDAIVERLTSVLSAPFTGDAVLEYSDIFRRLGIDLDALERAAEAVGIELPLDDIELFIDGLRKTAEAIRDLDLAILRESYEGARNWATLVADVFDEELTPQKEFEILQESIQKIVNLGIEGFGELQRIVGRGDIARGAELLGRAGIDFAELVGDPNNPATVQAWENFSRFLVENFDLLFKEGFFGPLTVDEALALLSDIDDNTDAMQELLGLGATDSGLQAISAQNKVTTEQADIMIALDQTRNFYLEQIRDNTGDMLQAMTEGALLTPPSSATVDRFTAESGGILIERMENNFEISGAGDPDAVATATIAQMDRMLGELTRQRIRGTGASPRRNR